MENKKELPDCCKPVEKHGEKNSFWQGLLYGIIPHAGCIAFIIVTILGTTAAIVLLKPIMMNAYFFYFLIAVSFVFAAISSVIYLRKNGHLSAAGVRRKWKYLSTMFGTTILINLLLFTIVFPVLADVGPDPSGAAVAGASSGPLSLITLKVEIPCSGHAPLISNELKTLGITAVNFKFPNLFEVGYDPGEVSKQEILGLNVFNTYPATVVSESADKIVEASPTASASSGGCGCGGSSCGVAGASCCGG